MRRLLQGILALALLWTAVPVYAANDLTLDQGDGTHRKLGGVGDRAKVVIYGGGAVQALTIASGVTTNTTTTAVAGVRGEKTYWARVAGTGAVTATVEFLGCHSTTVSSAECVSIGTITLSGTTSKYDVPTPAVGTASYPYMAVTTTSVTGTGATVSAGVYY